LDHHAIGSPDDAEARIELPSGARGVARGSFVRAKSYMLVSAYVRCAYPEMMASAIFPLFLWGIFELERDTRKAFGTIPISFAAIWLSNLPAGVIAGYSMACVLLVVSVVRRSIKPLLQGFAAGFTGLGLAAFTLLPAAWEQKWVYIDAVVRPNQLPNSNFLFSPFGVTNMYKFNHQVSRLAILLILGAVVAAATAWQMRNSKSEAWWSLTVLCTVSAFLMFPLSAPIWRRLPELRYVQFPWRWLFPMCAAAALLASFALIQSSRRRMLLLVLAFALIAVDATVVHTRTVYPHFVDETAAKLQSQHGYAGLLEYTPLANKGRFLPVEASLIEPVDPSKKPDNRSLPIYIEVWSPERKVIRADLPQPMTVNLKLLSYPAWQASVNGKPAALQDNPQTGQLMMVLPAGASRTEIRFVQTWDRAVGAEISIGSGVVLIAFWRLIVLSRKRAVEPREAEVVPAKAA
jgi:hypothetical protein